MNPAAPLLGFIGRLDMQKGVDMIADNYEWLMSEGAQLVLLGSGRPDLEEALRRVAAGWLVAAAVQLPFVPPAHYVTCLLPLRCLPAGAAGRCRSATPASAAATSASLSSWHTGSRQVRAWERLGRRWRMRVGRGPAVTHPHQPLAQGKRPSSSGTQPVLQPPRQHLTCPTCSPVQGWTCC